VLSKCANPACLSRFHYLHQGKIFNIETGAISPDRKRPSTRKIEHFWLCATCAQTLTVAVENGVATTRPLRLGRAEGAAQENVKGKPKVA
jgi:hypothetical protein